MDRLPADMKSNKCTVRGLKSAARAPENTRTAATKEARTAVQLTTPLAVLPSTLLPRPLIRNPIRGNNGISQTDCIVIFVAVSIRYGLYAAGRISFSGGS